MNLDEFHFNEFCAGMVGEQNTASCAVQVVHGYSVVPSNPAGRNDDGLRHEYFEKSFFPVVAKSANHLFSIFQQADNGVFLINIDTLMDSVILKRSDHFQTGAVTYVRESRILMPTKISLENSSVVGPVKNGTPGFELFDPIG